MYAYIESLSCIPEININSKRFNGSVHCTVDGYPLGDSYVNFYDISL